MFLEEFLNLRITNLYTCTLIFIFNSTDDTFDGLTEHNVLMTL